MSSENVTQWHLFGHGRKLQTDAMRLPQSIHPPVSIRVFSTVLLIVSTTLMSAAARAATAPLVCSPAHLRLGTVTIGQNETQLIALTNTGASTTTISAISVSGAEFSVSGLSLPATLAGGESVTLSVAFAPTTNGWASGKVTFTTGVGSVSLPISGTGVTSESVTAAPVSLSFGSVPVGTSLTLPVVVTNRRSWNGTVTALQAVGAGYSVSGPALPLVLAPGQSATLNVSFTPSAAGLEGGSIFISGPSLNVPLTATGTTVGQLTIGPATLSFGNVLVGATGIQTATLSATGGSVTVSSAASSSSQFALPGVSFPLTIAAGQSVQLNVDFTPQKAGSASATLSFSSNASNSRASESLTGTGTPPQVSLSWNASSSPISGYNIYRGASPGSYSKINAVLDPNTSYTDTTVVPGATYYYAATAVNSSGEESAYSTPVEVVVQ